jgi:hypothetical protein
LLYFLVAVPVTSTVLGILALRRRGGSRLTVIATLLSYWLISGLIVRHFSEVRDASRWLFQAKTYKARVLALPVPPSGEFKNVEWDGWGFAGAGDTTVYLVVDPSDSLSEPAKDHLSGNYKGISCSSLESRLMSDLNMLAVTGGGEHEWRTPLEVAGFRMAGVYPVGSELGVLEAKPALA